MLHQAQIFHTRLFLGPEFKFIRNFNVWRHFEIIMRKHPNIYISETKKVYCVIMTSFFNQNTWNCAQWLVISLYLPTLNLVSFGYRGAKLRGGGAGSAPLPVWASFSNPGPDRVNSVPIIKKTLVNQVYIRIRSFWLTFTVSQSQVLHRLAPKCKLIDMHGLINKSTNDYVTLLPCENGANVNSKG